METYNSIWEIARADFLKRGWDVNPLHRLPHEGELMFRFEVNTTPSLSILVQPVVAGRLGKVDITFKLYLEQGGIVAESSIPPRRRLLLPDVKYPTHTYQLDTQDLPAAVVLEAWKSLTSDTRDTMLSNLLKNIEGASRSIIISPTKGISEKFVILNSIWLCLGDPTDGDGVRVPTETYTTPPAAGLRGVLYELKAICKCYLEQTTEFGKVIWLQYLIAKFCNFYCSETNEVTRKTLLHILSTKTGLRPSMHSEGPNRYVLDLDHGLRYRFCATHPYRAHALFKLPDEELNAKFPNETLQVSVYGTIVNERPLSRPLDKDFHNLLEYVRLPDSDALTWVEFCKLHFGEYGFMALVESRPEYQLIRHLNKEKK